MGLWNNSLCGYGIATSLDYALCETFTALYNALGGIGSGAIITSASHLLCSVLPYLQRLHLQQKLPIADASGSDVSNVPDCLWNAV